jgi:hypothetical protein
LYGNRSSITRRKPCGSTITGKEHKMINDDVKAELNDLSYYYCSDVCERRDEGECDNCPLEGFLVWLDTQTETDEIKPVAIIPKNKCL